MISRRDFLGMSLGTGATLALTPELLRAFQKPAAKLIQRGIPSSGEMLPAIGLHFGNPAPPDHAALKEVLKTLLDNGGKFLDTVHGNSPTEEVTATIATELGVQDKIFWGSRASPAGPPPPGPSDAAAKAQMERSLARFKVAKLDLVLMNPMADPGHLAALKEMKKEGRVRYIGMQVIDDRQYAGLEKVMRTEPLDVIGIDYSVGNRAVEQTILPLAQERKMAVVAYFPFDAGGLFQRAGTAPIPAWAADFDAKTWAQFFIKYVVSHPSVIAARTGTTNGAHMLDNIGGGTGRLPNAAMRKRMAQLVDTFPAPPAPAPPPQSAGGRTVLTEEQMQQQKANQPPGIALSVAILDRYVGEYQHVAAGTVVTVRRESDKLLVKVQTRSFQEEHFRARSETRFAAVPYALEFQLDGQGKVTGATWEQGPAGFPPQRIQLVRR
jgi:aryl-alcohol dehydrogenase-like predicted oxidoreductase